MPALLVAAADPWIRWDWISRHSEDIWLAVLQHLELTVIAVALGFVIALPLAVFGQRRNWARAPIVTAAGILYTIPSLALFAFLVPWTGLSRTTSEIGLVGYTLLILVRNLLAGLDGVPEETREAAQGMGFTRRRQLLQVELPLAAPAILAGVRVATVTTIGLVTVTALIGQGGVGQLILEGLSRDFRTPLVVGLALSIALAVTADVLLVAIERRLTPWASARTRS